MKLELILRLLDNDELSPEQVNDVKDFLDAMWSAIRWAQIDRSEKEEKEEGGRGIGGRGGEEEEEQEKKSKSKEDDED
ncbi:hypothetical protein DM860_014527 [Cuscuta australis]|uniref:Uncharacterized protein n=1 Tax=Cuscuta australis TaxID=267555 RepID=A0A328DXX6_9ASTE|nr:hypothetical protein DM860_014527 [Cuscuta australis]